MVIDYIKKARKFVQEELWTVNVRRFSKSKAFLYRFLRIGVITFTEFTKDKCGEKASALTYFSLLSVVPVLAMAFGIATIFGLDNYLRQELDRYLEGQAKVLDHLISYAKEMLATSNGGIISGISAIFLIYAVVRLFSNIETTFNGIWDAEKGRSLKRKITDYMSIILLGPIILIISGSATAYITSSIGSFAESIEFLRVFKPGILFLINLIPYTLIWILLFLVYMIFPNASVKPLPALIAGVIAGSVFQITQVAWIQGQVYLSRYNVIYGSLAILPLFMIWLQLSWMIILFGAELSFAIQNHKNWSYDDQEIQINQQTKKRFTLLVLKIIISEFETKNKPVSFDGLFGQISIPRRFVHEITRDLEAAGLIVRVASEDDEELYVPGMDIYKIDVYTVFKSLENRGLNNLPQQDENEGFKEISELLGDLDATIRSAPANKLVKDL